MLAASDRGSYVELKRLIALDEEEQSRWENETVSSSWSKTAEDIEAKTNLQNRTHNRHCNSWLVEQFSPAIACKNSVSCRFCHADVTLLENVSSRSRLGSSWIVSCQNEHCSSRKSSENFLTNLVARAAEFRSCKGYFPGKKIGVGEFSFFVSFKSYDYFSEKNACFINSQSLTACQTNQTSNQNFPTPFFKERCQEDIAILIAFSRSNPTLRNSALYLENLNFLC